MGFQLCYTRYSMSDAEPPPLPRFELAARELHALGIALTCLPGDYRVNVIGGSDAAAMSCDELEEAVAVGRRIAQERPSAPAREGVAPRRRRPKRMTAKAIRRRMIRAHNQRMRGRAIKAQRKDE